jgi:hypothetical protein
MIRPISAGQFLKAICSCEVRAKFVRFESVARAFAQLFLARAVIECCSSIRTIRGSCGSRVLLERSHNCSWFLWFESIARAAAPRTMRVSGWIYKIPIVPRFSEEMGGLSSRAVRKACGA